MGLVRSGAARDKDLTNDASTTPSGSPRRFAGQTAVCCQTLDAADQRALLDHMGALYSGNGTYAFCRRWVRRVEGGCDMVLDLLDPTTAHS